MRPINHNRSHGGQSECVMDLQNGRQRYHMTHLSLRMIRRKRKKKDPRILLFWLGVLSNYQTSLKKCYAWPTPTHTPTFQRPVSFSIPTNERFKVLCMDNKVVDIAVYYIWYNPVEWSSSRPTVCPYHTTAVFVSRVWEACISCPREGFTRLGRTVRLFKNNTET